LNILAAKLLFFYEILMILDKKLKNIALFGTRRYKASVFLYTFAPDKEPLKQAGGSASGVL
jgi:hypothetical protein